MLCHIQVLPKGPFMANMNGHLSSWQRALVLKKIKDFVC